MFKIVQIESRAREMISSTNTSSTPAKTFNRISLFKLSGYWYYTDPEKFASQWMGSIAWPQPSGGKINSVMHGGFGTPRLHISFGFILLSFFLLFSVLQVSDYHSLVGKDARGEWGRGLSPCSSSKGSRLDPAVVASPRLLIEHHQ